MNGARSGVSTFGAGAGGGTPKKQPLQSNSASPNGQQQQQQQQKSIIEIYTDWANHYLEKLKNKSNDQKNVFNYKKDLEK